MVLTWFYTRIVLLSYCIYVATFKVEVYSVSPYVQPIYGFLLSCLLILDVYWFYVFLQIARVYFIHGVCEDLQNKSGREEFYLRLERNRLRHIIDSN